MPCDFWHALFASILPIEIEMAFSVIALLGFSAWMIKGLWQQVRTSTDSGENRHSRESGNLIREAYPGKERAYQSTRLLIISILAVAFLLRLGWIFSTQPLPHSDFQVYWDYAHRFYHGDFRFDVIERHPGIILLYTLGFYILGDSLWAGWTINLFFSILFLLTLYSLSLELFGKRVALCALAFGTLLPTAISYTPIMASETPAVTYMMMSIWAALRMRKLTVENKGKQSVWVALGVGCLLFGSALIRSTSLLLPILFCLSIVIFRGTKWKKALALMLGSSGICALLLSGWIAHQAIITGIPKLFFGEELWLVFASNYDHNGRIFPIDSMPFYPRYIHHLSKGDAVSRIHAYKILGDYSWQVIKADPLKYLLFGFTRMRGILWFSQSGIVWSIKNSSIGFTLPVRMRLLTEISNTCWRILLILGAVAWVKPQFKKAFFNRLNSPPSEGWTAQPDGVVRVNSLQNSIKGSGAVLDKPPRAKAHPSEGGEFLSINLEESSPGIRETQLVISLFIVCWLIFHFLMAVVSERYAFQLLPFILMYSAKGGGRLVEWVANTVKKFCMRQFKVN